MEDLLIIYRSIEKSAFKIKIILNSLEEIPEDNLQLFDYFYDFNSVDFEAIDKKLMENNIFNNKADEILGSLKILKDTYEKYHVNNVDELALLILRYWKENKYYSDSIIRNVLLIEYNNRFHNLVKSNVSLLEIYIDMVNDNMITNPNLPIGSSSERLYTMLPDDQSCYEENLKIIASPTIDWMVYRNGCNPLEHFCYLYNTCKTCEERKYYHDLIITAINSKCSLFNNNFSWPGVGKKYEQIINYYLVAAPKDIGDGRHPIKDATFIKEINELLLTDELFNHQMELYTQKNNAADEVIQKLILLRENRK